METLCCRRLGKKQLFVISAYDIFLLQQVLKAYAGHFHEIYTDRKTWGQETTDKILVICITPYWYISADIAMPALTYMLVDKQKETAVQSVQQ